MHEIRVGAEVVELSAAEHAAWLRAEPGAALVERGLLVEVLPDNAVGFASRHRLIPLALGLGTVEPGLVGLGLLHHPLVLLAPALADLVQWSPLSPDLWHACRVSAEAAAGAGIEDPEQIDPRQVLDGVLAALLTLLGGRAACVDVRL
ncbi:hypothetical protein [Lentzea aerocolonigenes]|uniref:hypothetical protein n=1 Tax=Lentzea aerocolonigenes TaxID=68170 RepID=UPI000AE6C1EB|nr:hypothetical protein [Lentzea aerocolonigenes]